MLKKLHCTHFSLNLSFSSAKSHQNNEISCWDQAAILSAANATLYFLVYVRANKGRESIAHVTDVIKGNFTYHQL